MKLKYLFHITIIFSLICLFESCCILRNPGDLVETTSNSVPPPDSYEGPDYRLYIPEHYSRFYVVGPEYDDIYSYEFRYRKGMCINIGGKFLNLALLKALHYDDYLYEGRSEPLIFQGCENGLYWKTVILFPYGDSPHPDKLIVEYANIPECYLPLFEESLKGIIARQKNI